MAKIKIKEENKGKFTAWAKSHGMSVQQAAATILRNREKYSPALIKRANFSRNASRWDEGGKINSKRTVYFPGADEKYDKNLVLNNGWQNSLSKANNLDEVNNSVIGSWNGSPMTMGQFGDFPQRVRNTYNSDFELERSKSRLNLPNTFQDMNINPSPGGVGGGDMYIPAGRVKPGNNVAYIGPQKFDTGGLMNNLSGAMGAINPLMGIAMAGVGMWQNSVNAKQAAKDLEAKQALGIQNTSSVNQANMTNNFPSTFKIGGQFKGKKFGGSPNATVGGGEIVITPDGAPTNMKGPSDMNGGKGMDVALPDQTIILSKKNSKDLLPLTNKINKSNEVLKGNASTMFAKNSAKRNLDRYMGTMMDAYRDQEAKKKDNPEYKGDQTDQFDGGGGFTNIESFQSIAKMFKDKYKADFNLPAFNQGNQDWYNPINTTRPTDGGNASGGVGVPNVFNSGNIPAWSAPGVQDLGLPQADMGSMNNWQNNNVQFSNPKDNPNSGEFVGGGLGGDKPNQFGDILSGIGEMAPMLYNLGRGLFGKKDTVNDSRYANPYEGQINSLMANRRYNIDAGLAGNEASYRTNAANMRNLGGSRGQVMSNLTGAQNAKQFADMTLYGQQQNVNNQYKGEQANMMYGLGRDTTATRMSVDEGNRMTDAAKNNMIGAGMSGLQQYLLTRRQMKNQSGRDKLLINAIKAYSPYSSKWIPGLDALGR